MLQTQFEQEIQRIHKAIPRMFYRLIPHYNPSLVTDELSPYALAARLQDALLEAEAPAPAAQVVAANALVSLLTPLRAPLLIDLDIAVHEKLNGDAGANDFKRKDFESKAYGPSVRFTFTEVPEVKCDRALQVSPALLATAPEVFELGDVLIARINTKGFLTQEATCVCRTYEGSQSFVGKSVHIRGELTTRRSCVAFYTGAIATILEMSKQPAAEEKAVNVVTPKPKEETKPVKKPVSKPVEEEVFG